MKQKVQQKDNLRRQQRSSIALPVATRVFDVNESIVYYVVQNMKFRFMKDSSNFTRSDWPRRLRHSVTRASRPIRMRLAIPIKWVGDCTLKESSNNSEARGHFTSMIFVGCRLKVCAYFEVATVLAKM